MVSKFVICFTTALAFAGNSFAETVEKLVAKNKWRDASRAIFVEARAANKTEPRIIEGQAKYGFTQDALESVAGVNPNQTPWLLALVIQYDSTINDKKKTELILQALTAARNISGKAAGYRKSGDLVRLSLLVVKTGREDEAKAIFAEAIDSAEAGLNDEGSGGFTEITSALNPFDGRGNPDVREWMFQPLQAKLSKTQNSASLTFSCIDVAKSALNLSRPDLAKPFVECAKGSLRGIDKRGIKQSAEEKLAAIELETGGKLGAFASPIQLAIQEARAGNVEAAHKRVSSLNENLYVSHKDDGFRRVFEDALQRGDLKTANYFAEHPVKNIRSYQMNNWQQLAEKNIELADKKSALENYQRASEIFRHMLAQEPNVYDFDFKLILSLGESMIKNGLIDNGKKVIEQASSLLLRIPTRQVDTQIKSSSALALTLWKIGNLKESQKYFLQSYRSASAYDVTRLHGDMEKARLLAELGDFAGQIHEQRLKAK